MRGVIRGAVVAAGAATVLIGTATPGVAGTVQPAAAKGGQAGFYVDPEGVNSMHASFVAPTVTCAVSSGVQQLRFGVVAPQVNSTVTEFAQLDATCTNGVLSYGTALGAGGNTAGGAVARGDSVTVSLSVTPSATSAKLVDHTKHHTYTVSGGGQTLDQTGFVGSRPVTGETAIPTFSSPVHFTEVLVNGLKITSYTHLREFQAHGRQVLIRASTPDRQTFDLKFVANT